MFLQERLTKKFMTEEYAAHRAQILWNREESFIPTYQIRAENIKKANIIKDTILDPLYAKRKILLEELEKMDNDISTELRVYNHLMFSRTAGTDETAVKNFTRKCPTNECKGWLSTAWKCSLCDNYTCSDCYVTIGEHRRGTPQCNHACVEGDLLTAKMIRDSTKPCPKCGVGIEKTEGCDMMFCVACHAAFRWNTGEIVTSGNIHNPHYYEWLQRTGGNVRDREHGDITCGGIPDHRILRGIPSTYYNRMAAIHRIVSHVNDIDLDNYNVTINDRTDVDDMMIMYLLNKETQESVKRKMMLKELARERARAFYDVFRTFVTVGSDYLRQFADVPKTGDEIERAVTVCEGQFGALIQYINEANTNIAKMFGISAPIIVPRNSGRFREFEVKRVRGGITAMAAATAHSDSESL
jgi:hypothetical protein